jgi:FKBP-type peptidyl-prolyl cis-trans isomerase
MKLKSKLTASLLALGSLAVLRAQEVKLPPAGAQPAAAPGTAPAAAASAPKFTETQILETFGWFIGKRIGLAELEFNKDQTDSVMKGILTAAAGKESPYDLQKIGPEMDKFMQEKQGAYMAKAKQQSTAESSKFLAETKAKQGVIALPSGLMYEIVKEGAGEFPKATDTVKVHYTGTLVNGTKFDSSVDRGEPAEFALNEVIPGWTEGIQKINKGGKIKLYIPANLAYGDEGRQGIPPSSTLVFDVELLDIKPPSAAPAAGALGAKSATPASTSVPPPAPETKK